MGHGIEAMHVDAVGGGLGVLHSQASALCATAALDILRMARKGRGRGASYD